ncbi:MAG: M28 family peptidase [Candidatus Lokiarchaeota archaeon]|nr:M28 family peptidase [Candidatus Lokiarchaeota archaeon]
MVLIKKSNKIIVITLIALAVVIPITVPIFLLFNDNEITNINIELQFDGDTAYNYVADQININTTHYRIPGTQGREDCAQYFINKFQLIDPMISFTLHNFTVQSIGCQNVLFKMNENYSNILILGTHYDSRAKATKDSTNPDLPVPGANDGASGSAVLIELARVLYEKRHNLSVQIWFLFFDAEDQGYDFGIGLSGWDWCEGSSKFVQDIENFHNSSAETFDAMILLDMVGGDNLRFISETYSTSSLLDELFETGRQLGFTSAFPSYPTVNRIYDDHVAFVDYGIPSADLIIKFWDTPAEWPYHHTTGDDLSHISSTSLEITGKTVEQFIYNNYYEGTNPFQGSFPWSGDLDLLDSELFIFVIIIIPIVGIAVVVLYLRSRSNKDIK